MQKKILVIDDDIDICTMLSFMFSKNGMQGVFSQNGKILENITEINPSLVLMDNSLDGISGQALCNRLKEDSRTNHFPVILLSANPGLEKIAADCRANAFLPKPFELKDLLAMIARYS